MPVKILFIGDIIGKPGREALSRELHRIVDRHMVSGTLGQMLDEQHPWIREYFHGPRADAARGVAREAPAATDGPARVE